MIYYVTKRYGHDLGLSACFRQWRADSHCRFIHGYALAFTFEFAANTVDHRNWVIDFGNLKELKQTLVDTFDHKLLVAEDDPMKDELCQLGGLDVADPLVMPSVGCEMFAKYGFMTALELLKKRHMEQRVWVHRVTCHEHAGNSASVDGRTRRGHAV